MFDTITSIIGKGSYLGVFLLMLLENVFPPIPSELIMPLAGYVATTGELSFWGVILAGTVGSLAGQAALYYAGRAVGEERLKEWADNHGYWVATSSGELERAQSWFKKHGNSAVFFGRLVPGVRSLISIPAGLTKMPVGQFLLYTLAGTFLWTAALTYLGRVLGQNYQKVEQFLNPISYLVVGGIVAWYLWRVYLAQRQP
ncbi:MAG: DedA family protein [Vulcanimicrobiota bacterium]